MPEWKIEIRKRLSGLKLKATREAEIVRELSQHLEDHYAELRAAGASQEEAERAVLEGLNQSDLLARGLERSERPLAQDPSVLGASRNHNLLSSLWHDLRYGLRVLRSSPGFTAVAVMSLALGIGANTAIFQLLDALRLRTLPVNSPQELAEVRIADMTGVRGAVNRDNSLTYRVWEQIRERQQALSGIFAWSEDMLNLSPAGEVRMERGLWVSGEFFQTLGIRAVRGRLFTPADDQRGCGIPGTVISYAFWQSEFGGDPSAIGRKLTLNGRPVEVIGVTPAGFSGLDVGRAFQVALPICSVEPVRGFNALDAGTFWWLTVMGRLKPGWSMERAAAQLNSISAGVFEASLPPNYPQVSIKDYLAMKLTALPAAAGISGLRDRYSVPLWMLLAIAGLVLLIACANLANLMLARGSVREREIAVRLAIGASRGLLIRQLMAESLLLACAGAAAGLFISHLLTRQLILLLGADESSIYLDLHPDWRVFTFAFGLAVMTCLLFGLTPALSATQRGSESVLQSARRGMTAGRKALGLRRLLVISQVALSLVLLVGALLFVRSLQNLLRVETGFQQDGVLLVDLSFARSDSSAGHVQQYEESLLQRLQTVPGVVSVADASVIPVSGTSWGNKVWMDGTNPAQAREALWSRIGPGYLRTLGIPLLAGRDFDTRDTPTSLPVAVINQAFARQIAGTQNPVGRGFRMEVTPSSPETVYEIVGLTRNSKYRSLRENSGPAFYLPVSQDPSPPLTDQLLIRSNIPLPALLPSVRRAISEFDPNARFAFQKFQAQVQESLLSERLMAKLSSAFAILAGLLSAIGLYGVISYMVARRRNEIGIRMALGAGRREILTMILGEGGTLLSIGLAAGTLMSLGAARAAATLLFGLQPYDPVTLISAAAVLAAVALAASYVPARRAARVDPMIALRDE